MSCLSGTGNRGHALMSATSHRIRCRDIETQLRALGQSHRQSNKAQRKYHPRRQITRLWSRELAAAVLSCPCEYCEDERWCAGSADIEALSDYIVGTPHASTTASVTFSLLLYIRHPQLIWFFYRQQICDEQVQHGLHHFTNEYLRKKVWRSFDQKCADASQAAAEEFESAKYQFFLPIIYDCPVSAEQIPSHAEEVLLPFLDQQLMSQEGAFGKVYSFDIHPEYNQIQAGPSVLDLMSELTVIQGAERGKRLVRKEVHYGTQGIEESELSTLIQVQRLNDKNVVKLLSAYKQGRKLNLIFPKAKTNLRHFLRDSSLHRYSWAVHDTEKHPFWWYMLDVMKALQRFASGVKCNTTGKLLHGYHFDLKPANILVDDTEQSTTFLIADFGFAQFADRSRLTAKGLTSAYAPPEVSQPFNKHDRNYDVWSMGCILLEVLAFARQGCNGVLELDRRREQHDPEEDFVDDSFWTATDRAGYQVKPQISAWIDDIVHRCRKQPDLSSTFVLKIVPLIKDMLDVDPRTRIDALGSYSRLNAILASSIPQGKGQAQDLQASEDESVEEVELGANELSTIRGAKCGYDDWWAEDCRVQVFENRTCHLRLILRNRSEKKSIRLGCRAETSLIPYAGGDATRLTIVNSKARIDVEIFLESSRDAILLQSVLLGQHASSLSTYGRSLSLQGSVSYRMLHFGLRLPCLKPKRDKERLVAATGVHMQIWTEHSYKDPEAWLRLRPRRDSPRTPFGRASPRRLVFFCKDSIIMVSVAKNARLKKPTAKGSAREHAIVPTDAGAASKDPTFAIAIFTPKPRSKYPSLPLDRDLFDALENESSVECTALHFAFPDGGFADSFRRKYVNIKKQWEDEARVLWEKVNYGAEDRGWAPLYYYEKTIEDHR